MLRSTHITLRNTLLRMKFTNALNSLAATRVYIFELKCFCLETPPQVAPWKIALVFEAKSSALTIQLLALFDALALQAQTKRVHSTAETSNVKET